MDGTRNNHHSSIFEAIVNAMPPCISGYTKQNQKLRSQMTVLKKSQTITKYFILPLYNKKQSL
jgi:hypothetical protein